MLRKALFAFALVVAGAVRTAAACEVDGRVLCQENGKPLGGVVVNVKGTTESGVPFTAQTTTGEDGYYLVSLPYENGTYQVALDLAAIGGGTVVTAPTPNPFTTTDTNYAFTLDWIVSSKACGELGCWLTGGGAKFAPEVGQYLAERAPKISFGGNVFPGCDPQSGQGGQWNHIDHAANLHFQAWTVSEVNCGNVDGIPKGSTSPVTPYNFIQFRGTGTLKPIANGTYAGPTNVCFVARAEDRNEPGSNGVRDGARKDRYYIEVYKGDCALNPTKDTRLYILGTDADPIIITDGNLQLHVSSCP